MRDVATCPGTLSDLDPESSEDNTAAEDSDASAASSKDKFQSPTIKHKKMSDEERFDLTDGPRRRTKSFDLTAEEASTKVVTFDTPVKVTAGSVSCRDVNTDPGVMEEEDEDDDEDTVCASAIQVYNFLYLRHYFPAFCLSNSFTLNLLNKLRDFNISLHKYSLPNLDELIRL